MRGRRVVAVCWPLSWRGRRCLVTQSVVESLSDWADTVSTRRVKATGASNQWCPGTWRVKYMACNICLVQSCRIFYRLCGENRNKLLKYNQPCLLIL